MSSYLLRNLEDKPIRLPNVKNVNQTIDKTHSLLFLSSRKKRILGYIAVGLGKCPIAIPDVDIVKGCEIKDILLPSEIDLQRELCKLSAFYPMGACVSFCSNRRVYDYIWFQLKDVNYEALWGVCDKSKWVKNGEFVYYVYPRN